MTRINWTRALLGGLLAAAVWGMLYAPLHPVVELHSTLGRPVLPLTPFRGASHSLRVMIVVTGFIQGIATVLLYAAIRPRFGAGSRTAVIAGASIWFLTGWMHLLWALFSAVPVTVALLPIAINLPLMVIAALAGAWFYKE